LKESVVELAALGFPPVSLQKLQQRRSARA